ncbi:MAG: hypothetical protein ACKVQW_10740 [Pyrinomonadaceae bacterium]
MLSILIIVVGLSAMLIAIGLIKPKYRFWTTVFALLPLIWWGALNVWIVVLYFQVISPNTLTDFWGTGNGHFFVLPTIPVLFFLIVAIGYRLSR